MNDLEMWEANELCYRLQYCDKPLREALRYNAYVTAQLFSKKKLKLSDVLKLPFDDLYVDHNIEDKDIERLKQATQLMQGSINI